MTESALLAVDTGAGCTSRDECTDGDFMSDQQNNTTDGIAKLTIQIW